MIPGVWNNITEKLFADGLGCRDGFEVIVLESSSPYSVEYVDHSIGDIWKLIITTTNSLRNNIVKYQDASFSTAKALSVFSTQRIRDKITSLCTQNK
ncbi:MAG: hypothetical protein EXX96DRAFT_650552 [Benjaminiella poitrasii]|nr:MAG: hypothetical protein EXX96DRAFT_650552 [Benjaminiella poitrasii]